MINNVLHLYQSPIVLKMEKDQKVQVVLLDKLTIRVIRHGRVFSLFGFLFPFPFHILFQIKVGHLLENETISNPFLSLKIILMI